MDCNWFKYGEAFYNIHGPSYAWIKHDNTVHTLFMYVRRSNSFHVNTQLRVGRHCYPGPLLDVELEFACLSG